MHLKEDHMKNGQLKPAYNIQLAVEAEYILDIDISPQHSDVPPLIPLLHKISEHHSGKLPARLIADAGYESEENYT